MILKNSRFIIVLIYVAQATAAKSNGEPLVPRLKYKSDGRQLNHPESITQFLAQYNLQGFPIELFYRSLEDELSPSYQPTMKEIAEALNSPEVQHSLEEAALDHFADVLNEPEAHAALKSSGKGQGILCSYSWLSWLPWLDCSTESRGSAERVPRSKQYAQCLEARVIQSFL